MKNSMKIALCGVLAALSVAVLLLTGVVPVATVALPALAGCLLIPIVAELGPSWGFAAFGVVGVLGLLLTPDREAALIYLLFFGYYPVLYGLLGRIGNRTVRYAVKLVIFNAAAVLEAVLAVYVLGIPWENVGFLGAATPVVLLLLANLVFVLYDRALGGLIAQYFARFRGVLLRLLRGR